MKRLLDFVSPWSLAGIAVWLVVMMVAYNWAIPIYANIGNDPYTFTVNVPDTATFAIVVSSIIALPLAGIVIFLGQRERTRHMAEVLLIAGTVGATIGLANRLFPTAVFPNTVTYVCDVSHPDRCTPMFIYLWSAAPSVAAGGLVAILAGLVILLRVPGAAGVQVTPATTP